MGIPVSRVEFDRTTVTLLYPESAGVESPRESGSWSGQDMEEGIALSIPARKLVVLGLVRRV